MDIAAYITSGPILRSSVSNNNLMTPSKAEALARLHQKRRDDVEESYRSKMQGKGWIGTAQIEALFCYGHGSCTSFLKTLEKARKVERRFWGGELRFNRRKGWEWRWVDGL